MNVLKKESEVLHIRIEVWYQNKAEAGEHFKKKSIVAFNRPSANPIKNVKDVLRDGLVSPIGGTR
jgi:hypothetical protein